jgi:hypothetical protein
MGGARARDLASLTRSGESRDTDIGVEAAPKAANARSTPLSVSTALLGHQAVIGQEVE